jgi:hypothetical protein
MGMLTEEEVLGGHGFGFRLPLMVHQQVKALFLVIPGFLVIDQAQVLKYDGMFLLASHDAFL